MSETPNTQPPKDDAVEWDGGKYLRGDDHDPLRPVISTTDIRTQPSSDRK